MIEPKPEKRIDYVELPMTDLQATRTFYESVFKWRFEDYGPGYTSFFDGRLAGGFTLAAAGPAKGILLVIYASDLADLQKQIRSAGGQILKDTFSFPGGHRFHFSDPNGNELAVWSDRDAAN
jgi:predicted enzyme related to lactoylglutathione lyase